MMSSKHSRRLKNTDTWEELRATLLFAETEEGEKPRGKALRGLEL